MHGCVRGGDRVDYTREGGLELLVEDDRLLNIVEYLGNHRGCWEVLGGTGSPQVRRRMCECGGGAVGGGAGLGGEWGRGTEGRVWLCRPAGRAHPSTVDRPHRDRRSRKLEALSRNGNCPRPPFTRGPQPDPAIAENLRQQSTTDAPTPRRTDWNPVRQSQPPLPGAQMHHP